MIKLHDETKFMLVIGLIVILFPIMQTFASIGNTASGHEMPFYELTLELAIGYSIFGIGFVIFISAMIELDARRKSSNP